MQWLDQASRAEVKLSKNLASDLADVSRGDYTGIIAYYRDRKPGKDQAITTVD